MTRNSTVRGSILSHPEDDFEDEEYDLGGEGGYAQQSVYSEDDSDERSDEDAGLSENDDFGATDPDADGDDDWDEDEFSPDYIHPDDLPAVGHRQRGSAIVGRRYW